MANPAWDDYRDGLGLMSGTLRPTQPDSNAVLFSAYERCLRVRLGTWGDAEQARLSRAIRPLVQDGTLERPAPWTQDEERPDNHIGLGGCGDPESSHAVLDHFDRHPDYLGAFKLRFTAFYAHLQWSAGVTPAWWRRAYWAASFLVSGDNKHQDPWLQGFVLVTIAGDKGWLERWATRVYWRKLNENWPGLGSVFQAFFSDNPAHPCAQGARNLGL